MPTYATPVRGFAMVAPSSGESSVNSTSSAGADGRVMSTLRAPGRSVPVGYVAVATTRISVAPKAAIEKSVVGIVHVPSASTVVVPAVYVPTRWPA